MTYKILVVDDEKLIQTLFKLRFKNEIEKNLYEFMFALNGVEALEKIETSPKFDLMLTDINMPKMDGLTLMGQLQEQLIFIPTIVVSAYSDPKNQKTAKDLGALDFLVKPINFKTLETIIHNYLVNPTLI